MRKARRLRRGAFEPLKSTRCCLWERDTAPLIDGFDKWQCGFGGRQRQSRGRRDATRNGSRIDLELDECRDEVSAMQATARNLPERRKGCGGCPEEDADNDAGGRSDTN